ncbi:MAG: DnaJ domain-containing protein, partial [Spirochaetes bacterium]|nr:DnaJ domain-containing protein [Spirochaetota bacterium]
MTEALLQDKNMLMLNDEVKNAFVLLFDGSFIPTIDIIKKINPDEIKSAYRKKALEFHPDRAILLGKNENEMSEDFKEINVAYDRLRLFLNENRFYFTNINTPRSKNGFQNNTAERKNYYNKTYTYAGSDNSASRENKHQQRNQTGGSRQTAQSYSLPNAEILIGQFLFWCKVITWKSLIEAIVWQRNQRPLFGEIARNWNILSDNEIRTIITEKNVTDRIGDYAFKKGYISQFEHLAIIGRQRSLQRPIGEFFVDNGYLSFETMEAMAAEHRRHNIKVKFG